MWEIRTKRGQLVKEAVGIAARCPVAQQKELSGAGFAGAWL
jgi:hypothetical protein